MDFRDTSTESGGLGPLKSYSFFGKPIKRHAIFYRGYTSSYFCCLVIDHSMSREGKDENFHFSG